MINIKCILSIFALIVLIGCKDDIQDGISPDVTHSGTSGITAAIEEAEYDAISRAVFASDASVVWTENDRIAVSQKSSGGTLSFTTFKLSDGAGSSIASFTGSVNSGYTIGDFLLYPNSIASDLYSTVLVLDMPSEYTYSNEIENFGTTSGNLNSINMPMLANYSESGVKFKHLGGYFVFEVSKIPVGACKFVFEVVNKKKIAGKFTVNLKSTNPSYSTSTSITDNKVVVNFPETTTECKRLFVIPVPVGAYDYEWNIYDSDNKLKAYGASNGEISVSRAQIKAKRVECVTISMAKYINGHEYIDLGLPSHTKWATCNVGADTPEAYGDYYAWGETSPKETFSWDNYLSSIGGTMTDKVDCGTSADPLAGYVYPNNVIIANTVYDAAKGNWGSTWKMPTKEQFAELCNTEYTTSSFIYRNGVYGRKIISKVNNSSIFLPAAGYMSASSKSYEGQIGYYASATPNSSDADYAYNLIIGSSYFYVESNYRYYGLSVRPVSE